MKFAVGVCSPGFGIFWGAEGAGASWPGGEASLAPLVAVVLLAALAMVAEVRPRGRAPAWRRRCVSLRRAFAAVWDFVVGDDWRLALAAVAAIGLTASGLRPRREAPGGSRPLVALIALRWSLRHATP